MIKESLKNKYAKKNNSQLEIQFSGGLTVCKKGAKPEDAAGRHWCFKAKWQTQVDAFCDAGITAGGSDDGAQGLRNYHASYYAAFLRDPDGNRIEAVCHAAI